MNHDKMINALQAMFMEWCSERNIEPLGIDEPDWQDEHAYEWIRFKAALDQALATMDCLAGE